MTREKPALRRSLRAGFTATLTWTFFMYFGSLFGMHQIDIAGILGSLLVGGPVFPFQLLWWLGLLMHLAIGAALFPALYSVYFYERLSGPPWMRGIQWGMILWLGSMLFFMPIVGAGVFAFSAPAPGLLVLSSLFQHILYGGLQGVLAGEEKIAYQRSPVPL